MTKVCDQLWRSRLEEGRWNRNMSLFITISSVLTQSASVPVDPHFIIIHATLAPSSHYPRTMDFISALYTCIYRRNFVLWLCCPGATTLKSDGDSRHHFLALCWNFLRDDSVSLVSSKLQQRQCRQHISSFETEFKYVLCCLWVTLTWWTKYRPAKFVYRGSAPTCTIIGRGRLRDTKRSNIYRWL